MIKIDMEIAKFCEDCIFRDCALEYRDYWKCWATKSEKHRCTTYTEYNPKSNIKPDWCPLIEETYRSCEGCKHIDEDIRLNCQFCAPDGYSRWEGVENE